MARSGLRQVDPSGVRSLPGTVLQTATTATSTTPTTTSASPTATTGLTFDPIQDMTACGSGTVTWQYSGGSSALTLSVTNLGLSTSDPSPVFNTLTTNIDPSVRIWTWNSVNVTAGTYAIEAFVGDQSTQSSAFKVVNGSDTSCLTASSPSSSSPSSSAGTVSGGSSKSTNVGAIAGGVVGGVIVLAAAAAVLFILLRASRNKRNGGMRNWGNLKSTDSHAPTPTPGYTTQSSRSHQLQQNSVGSTASVLRHGHHLPSESVGTILSGADHRTPGTTPGGSEEDVGSLADEKTIASVGGGPFDLAKPLAYTAAYPGQPNRRGSSTSSVSYTQYQNSGRPRAATAASSATNLHNTSPVSPAYTADSPNRRRSSIDGAVYLRNGAPTSPRSPDVAEMIPMERSASGHARRTPRKAVPKYNPEDLPPPPLHVDAAPASRSHIDLTHSPISPNLNHKSSFGPGDNRPVHYLIPDMPPPARD
ncbi:hypothetical protein PLICRDRAFT_173173 [Plicaturopsis crispa FD-325 SS-3]|nr:hypothetical protein PLICRDRAFT_173173 [Plicaturopsis crispa FD-325 SS-3]